MTEQTLDKKLKHWEHQLLDLGKRNKMIHYRETKRTTIKLVEPSFDVLYDRLAVNEEVLTFQNPVDRETDIRVFSILSLLETMSSPLPVMLGDIATEGGILERQRTLRNLRTKSRLAQEEKGTHILYLSFGFIEWRDGKGASAPWIKSPLILVPVTLALESLNAPYTLRKHEEDIVVNPTLEHYLKTEYGVELPPYDAENDTPDGYLKGLEEIADKRGWRILREVSLGLLSFLKISMYNDLLRNEARIKQNPVIRAMSGDSEQANEIPPHLRNFDLDSIGTQDCYQVMSADSSQQDAILYSKNNISFVMQGPPGTGKSQTITNIIAEALAEGKKVLFVSEKMAALQVVYRRLQEAQLGEFCLPLHSYKANKKEILEQIGANLKLKPRRVTDSSISNLEELLSIRKELNGYASELHALNPELNISCYEVYSKLEEVSGAATLGFFFDDPLGLSQSDLQAVLNALREYALALQRMNYAIENNPWEGLSARLTGYEYEERMRDAIHTLTASVGTLETLLRELGMSSVADTMQYREIPAFAELVEQICDLPYFPPEWLGDFDFHRAIRVAEEAKHSYKRLELLKEEISEVFTDGIHRYDYNGWKHELLEQASDFASLGFWHDRSVDFVVENTTKLRVEFAAVKAALEEASKRMEAVNRLLGTEFRLTERQLPLLEALAAELQNGVTSEGVWFSADLSAVRKTARKAEKVIGEMEELKRKLLTAWEPEILELDYTPILLRYKTEYTGLLKFLNSNYKRDKRSIQALSKTVLKSLPDELAVSLLGTLKEYHSKVKWLKNHESELKQTLGSRYVGVETDWNAVAQAMDVCERLRALFGGEVPSGVCTFAATEHREKTVEFTAIVSELHNAWVRAKDAISETGAEIDLVSESFDCCDLQGRIDLLLLKLDGVAAQSEEMKPYLVDKTETSDVVYRTIEQLNAYRELSAQLRALAPTHQALFGTCFAETRTDWDEILIGLARVSELKCSENSSSVASLLSRSTEEKRRIKTLASELNTSYDAGAFAWITQQFDEKTALASMSLPALCGKLRVCEEQIPALGLWIDYAEAKEQCAAVGLADFTEKLEKAGLYREENPEHIFLKGFYRLWLGAVCDHASSVRRFRRNTQDERIKRFIELDDLQLKIAQLRIREKLIGNLPTSDRMVRATDEVAILKKELGKKRNIMPLRKLFRMIPNLLLKLKPCLMMSPLSVSYFLETEAYHFDLVIFDEASQIFPEDAIGAIFRGSQVIIAGDSKQLPPTNFFSSTTNNFDGEYDLPEDEDFAEMISDSILEETASVLPNRTLRWHYRSKHESLIAFSNREIYKNSLITFPNSTDNVPDMGVEYLYVEDGVYDRGGKKNNVKEAEMCVKLVFEHIEAHPDRSLGIIAFSESQQNTIESAIIDYRERHPEYEWFFDEGREEPFFIKNLENVQGDERDTIIFSICYGKDHSGKMYMNFGPVGHNGGERRLNVAITRAKSNIKLVGSILPSDIDVDRAKSEGARMLRAYIEYARKGTVALKPTECETPLASEDGFCEIVARFLEENGYSIERRVGCSDYKIDIAVRNPNADGEYIAGIECDGLSYIGAKTARDRDHLRASVLKRMGWNLYRVWSTEWSRNPKEEQQALLEFLHSVYDPNGNVIHNVTESNAEASEVSVETIAAEHPSVSSENPYGFAYYEESVWWQTKRTGDEDNLTSIAKIILHIVGIEQPICIDQLYKRMGSSFTVGKVTEGVKRTIDHVISETLKDQVVLDEEGFVWLNPKPQITVRIPKPGETPRSFEHIHPDEVAAAMLKIVENTFGITTDELASECARVFGFERRGPKIKAKTQAVITRLSVDGQIRIIDGKVQLTGESL